MNLCSLKQKTMSDICAIIVQTVNVAIKLKSKAILL